MKSAAAAVSSLVREHLSLLFLLCYWAVPVAAQNKAINVSVLKLHHPVCTAQLLICSTVVAGIYMVMSWLCIPTEDTYAYKVVAKCKVVKINLGNNF